MANVADMTGKTVVVTGANSGIGLETAVALARAGARVVMTARDPQKGAAALEDVKARAGSQSVELVVFDLGDLADVRKGAAKLLDLCPRLDVLVNNAGAVLSARRETVDGLEATFGVNHLGPFLLTELLLDRLRQSAPARIVNVASTAHKGAGRGLDFDDLQTTNRYTGMGAYSKSKLANIYFTTELARRLEGSGVTVNCLHPGTVVTGFGRDGDANAAFALGLKIIAPFIIDAEKGSRTSVYLASSPEVADVTGKYFVKCSVRTPSKAARDDGAAARLWQASEELVAQKSPA